MKISNNLLYCATNAVPAYLGIGMKWKTTKYDNTTPKWKVSIQNEIESLWTDGLTSGVNVEKNLAKKESNINSTS